jgi:RNA polymerase sigma factor (sigma-70 family)
MDAPGNRTQEVLDELLVLRAQEGSREAFEALATRWQERLWRHARRLTGRDDAAWDALQEAWIGIAGGLAGLRDAGAFRCWAYTIVTRAANGRARRAPDERPAAPEALDALAGDDGAEDERARAVARLRAALDRLAGGERALLSLRYLEGLGLRELSRVFGIPEGTVKSRLFHAREHLRETLERMQP